MRKLAHWDTAGSNSSSLQMQIINRLLKRANLRARVIGCSKNMCFGLKHTGKIPIISMLLGHHVFHDSAEAHVISYSVCGRRNKRENRPTRSSICHATR